MTKEQLKRIWRSGERLEEWTNTLLDLTPRRGDFSDVRRLWVRLGADDDALALLARGQRIVEVEAPAFEREAKEACGQIDTASARLKAMADGLAGVPVRATQKVNRKVGRPKGSAPGVVRAYADVARINNIWRKIFGTHYRTASPTAIDIAARRHGLTPAQLDNYRKNRSGR